MKHIDLTVVKERLQHDTGWAKEFIDALEVKYLEFLQGKAKNPTPAIDAFWHTHILFTSQYKMDCEELCGCFIHHIPTAKKPKGCRKKAAA